MNKYKINSNIFDSDKQNRMFRIEYDIINEELHFEDPDVEHIYGQGVFIISNYVSYADSMRFINYIKKRYPFDLPDYFTTYLEFQLFLSLN